MKIDRFFTKEYNSSENGVDSNIIQGDPNSCAVRSQEIIMRDYGIIVPENELISFAEANGWFNEGTAPQDLAKILNSYGIDTNFKEMASIKDIMNELNQGHRVIIGVDSGELWADNVIDKTLEEVEDLIGGNSGADHALIVSSVNVNPNDPKDIKVQLTDSGTGQIKEYSFSEFQNAWNDSNCTMVSTTQPAPYQYNSDTAMMEPSNFATDYILKDFISSNTFSLEDVQMPTENIFSFADVQIPVGYTPSFDELGIFPDFEIMGYIPMDFYDYPCFERDIMHRPLFLDDLDFLNPNGFAGEIPVIEQNEPEIIMVEDDFDSDIV